MKRLFLIIVLISINSYGQLVFDFDVNNGSSIVDNNLTGYTEVIQNINGSILTVSSEAGDVSISNGKVVANNDWIYFNFNTNVKLSNFNLDFSQGNHVEIKMYDINGIELVKRSTIAAGSGFLDLTYNNTITNDFISKVWLNFVNLGFSINYITISDNELGLDDFNKNEISLYPNPVNDILYIQGNNSKLNVSIFNMLGEKVITKNQTTHIDLSSLKEGVYIAKLSSEEKTITKKIIKH